jgi:hypothetical protein
MDEFNNRLDITGQRISEFGNKKNKISKLKQMEKKIEWRQQNRASKACAQRIKPA